MGKEGDAGMSFDMMPNELAKALRLYSGSGGGKPLFEKIDLKVVVEDGKVLLTTRHKSEFDHYITGKLVLPNGSPGEVATNSPERLISYVESGIFDPKSPLTVRANDAWLELRSAGQQASIATDALDTVLKAKETTKDGKPFYSPGPWGCDIVTDPNRVPADGDWAKAGYALVPINRADLERVLKAAERLKADYAKTVLLTFDVTGKTVKVRCGPISGRDPRASKIDLTLGNSTPTEGSPDFAVAVQYDGLDSMLLSLKNYPDAEVALLHRPGERRSNILIRQGPADAPVLRVTQTFVHHTGSGKKD